MATKKIIGHVGVDAGMMYLGDPCYVIPPDGPVPRKLRQLDRDGSLWGTFLDHYVRRDNEPVCPVEGSLNASLGIVVTSFGGDGVYPVEVTIKDDLVTSVTIRFDR